MAKVGPLGHRDAVSISFFFVVVVVVVVVVVFYRFVLTVVLARFQVPNYDSFLPVVRCVRKWAKARGLYSNKMGYLGGVNFNIMVAFASQV